MDWQTVVSDILVLIPEIIQLPIATGGSWFSIFMSIPDMLKIAKQLRQLGLDSETLYNAVKMIPVMNAAIQSAQQTGDTSALEALFGKPQAKPGA
jgi:hypothetical protein